MLKVDYHRRNIATRNNIIVEKDIKILVNWTVMDSKNDFYSKKSNQRINKSCKII
jgi:hypothetical protein